MAFLGAALPYISAAGAAYSGIKSAQASTYNAAVAGQEQKTSIDQANQQEIQVRRAGRLALDKQSAAFAGAGVGGGVSSGIALDQSAVNQELDALNTRYRGATTGYGYGVQASLDKQQASGYTALAGIKALQGIGGNYSFYNPGNPTGNPSYSGNT
jgi:hypothetical protein